MLCGVLLHSDKHAAQINMVEFDLKMGAAYFSKLSVCN
jgi:hypothetical protein